MSTTSRSAEPRSPASGTQLDHRFLQIDIHGSLWPAARVSARSKRARAKAGLRTVGAFRISESPRYAYSCGDRSPQKLFPSVFCRPSTSCRRIAFCADRGASTRLAARPDRAFACWQGAVREGRDTHGQFFRIAIRSVGAGICANSQPISLAAPRLNELNWAFLLSTGTFQRERSIPRAARTQSLICTAIVCNAIRWICSPIEFHSAQPCFPFFRAAFCISHANGHAIRRARGAFHFWVIASISQRARLRASAAAIAPCLQWAGMGFGFRKMPFSSPKAQGPGKALVSPATRHLVGKGLSANVPREAAAPQKLLRSA